MSRTFPICSRCHEVCGNGSRIDLRTSFGVPEVPKMPETPFGQFVRREPSRTPRETCSTEPGVRLHHEKGTSREQVLQQRGRS